MGYLVLAVAGLLVIWLVNKARGQDTTGTTRLILFIVAGIVLLVSCMMFSTLSTLFQ